MGTPRLPGQSGDALLNGSSETGLLGKNVSAIKKKIKCQMSDVYNLGAANGCVPKYLVSSFKLYFFNITCLYFFEENEGMQLCGLLLMLV